MPFLWPLETLETGLDDKVEIPPRYVKGRVGSVLANDEHGWSPHVLVECCTQLPDVVGLIEAFGEPFEMPSTEKKRPRGSVPSLGGGSPLWSVAETSVCSSTVRSQYPLSAHEQ